MELEKRNIHMNKQKCRSIMQITIDNDINVPDVKPDIGKIITERGEIRITEAKAADRRAVIKGELVFHVLYADEEDEYKISHMEGVIDINEVVNLSDSCGNDNIWVRCELEDITSSIVNSRKVSIKAVVKLTISAEEISDEEAAVSVNDDSVMQLKESGTLTELTLCKKDIFRINEDISIPPGRDSAGEVLFYDVSLRNIETRMLQNSFGLRGEVKVFILYQGIENDRVNSYETSLPFSGEIDCAGCDEGMIASADVCIREKNMSITSDEDGEDRIFDVELVLGVDMKVYKEDSIQLLNDVYSVYEDIIPEYKEISYNDLILKNNSKARIQERIRLDEDDPGILQLCNADACVRIDEERIVHNGIETEGVVEISLLYFTNGEDSVLNSYKKDIPFEHFIEVNGINNNCIYDINAGVDRVNVSVNDQKEIDVKADISLDTIVFVVVNKKIITDCIIGERDPVVINEIPGITGYITQMGDTLWSVAKQFLSTVDSIKSINGLESDEIVPGQKLLIVKNIPEI